MRTLIRQATCVLPTGAVETNVLFDEHGILDVAAAANATADEVVDAAGFHLLPGVIDDQVHFRDPGLTHKEDLHTASIACAKGGVTSFLEMPNTKPEAITQERINQKLALGAAKSVVNYGFYIGATIDNIEHLKRAERVPGIKIFIGSSTGDLLVDDQEALERIFAETTLPICAHCEDETIVRRNMASLAGTTRVQDHSRIRDHEAAIVATRRAVDLATRHRHRFHVLHVSTGAEAGFLRTLPRDLITAEVCPHHLYFNVQDYDRLGSLVQMNPSIKFAEDNDELWRALADGTIQAIATDHAPHTLAEKQQPYPKSPSGLPAVENVLALTLDAVAQGRLTLERAVEALSDAPARIWGMQHKGRIAAGYHADLVLVDLAKRHTVRNEEQATKCGWTPWHGAELQGWPLRTWVMGRTVFQSGKVDTTHRGQEITYDHTRGYW
jgi:dihydroorotase